MLSFVSGLITMGLLVAGLFFAKFWTRTRDALFGAFAGAFGLLALEQALLAWEGVPRQEQTFIYLLRLAAFTVIILAIAAKNWRRAR